MPNIIHVDFTYVNSRLLDCGTVVFADGIAVAIFTYGRWFLMV